MGRIVIAGGGWAGCAAAVSAAKQGTEVILLEKTDLLLGAGNVGGIMRNNGRLTAEEENRAMGAGELFEIAERCAVHRKVDFPGHKHASFYDAGWVEPEVRRLLRKFGVEIRFCSRVVDVGLAEPVEDGRKQLAAAEFIQNSQSQWLEGDCFIDATGSSGPMGNCSRHGNGCAMCIQRCPAFGPRVSLTARGGVSDMSARRRNGDSGPCFDRLGAFSGSCKLDKTSLSRELQEKLKYTGYAAVPLPDSLIRKEKLREKVCQQYALEEFAENLILIDTGQAKLMSPYFSLEELRMIPGFASARFLDPYGGSLGNSVRYMSVSPREDSMQARGFRNLFVAGEKSGFFVGHTEAITTGSLAGYNACRIKKEDFLVLPRTLACGEMLAYAQEVLQEEDGLYRRLTFAGGEFLQRMKTKRLYTDDREEIRRRTDDAGLLDIYSLPKRGSL